MIPESIYESNILLYLTHLIQLIHLIDLWLDLLGTRKLEKKATGNTGLYITNI